MAISPCCKKELSKSYLWSGREKLGRVYYCPQCLEILYYQGEFHWPDWKMKKGTHGWGAYYKDQGEAKVKVPMHGLDRKEMLAPNAYVKED